MTRDEMKKLADRLMPRHLVYGYYHILDDNNNVVQVDSFGDYILWQMDNEHRRIVRQEDIGEGRFLSTVFLGVKLAPSFLNTTPLVFETALLKEDGPTDILDRYATYDGAVAGHEMYKQKILECESGN